MKPSFETFIWRSLGFLKPGASETGELPPEVVEYLSSSNPYLVDLKNRYASAKQPAHSSWESWESKVNLLKFRGENDYLSQAYFRQTTRRYELTYAYVECTDEMRLLEHFTEDRFFGVKGWEFVPGKLATRDLLDSIIEINHLKSALNLGIKDAFRVLDIGAGYGRFAHRFTSAFPASSVTCIDAVATSSFLSDFYLKFRKAERAEVVPFDQSNNLQHGAYHLATNIHSWSECTREFVAYWLDIIADLRIPYLFIVPHFGNFSTKETDGSVSSYEDELARHGFKLLHKTRKFNRSKLVDNNGVFPADYCLFQRQS